jgi:hypothetical protein
VSGFSTRPSILPLPNDRWAFDGVLIWNDGEVIVPKGFVMNGASIPRVFWSTIGHPLDTQFVYAAGVHDYECTVQVTPPAVVHRRFGAMLKAEGVGVVRRTLMVAAVRAFGPRWSV